MKNRRADPVVPSLFRPESPQLPSVVPVPSVVAPADPKLSKPRRTAGQLHAGESNCQQSRRDPIALLSRANAVTSAFRLWVRFGLPRWEPD